MIFEAANLILENKWHRALGSTATILCDDKFCFDVGFTLPVGLTVIIQEQYDVWVLLEYAAVIA